MYEKEYTVEEVYGLIKDSYPIQVESAYNGKVLCKNYKPERHVDISARVVYCIAPAFAITQNKDCARAYLRVIVRGLVEYEEERRKRGLQNG